MIKIGIQVVTTDVFVAVNPPSEHVRIVLKNIFDDEDHYQEWIYWTQRPASYVAQLQKVMLEEQDIVFRVGPAFNEPLSLQLGRLIDYPAYGILEPMIGLYVQPFDYAKAINHFGK